VIRVLVLYGGRSSEHGVSCLSARSVLAALDPARYEVVAVGITRDGRWTLTDGTIPTAPGRALPEVADSGPTVTLAGGRDRPRLLRLDDDGAAEPLGPVDVAFPVLHGPYGEDGTIQGMCATLGLPFVGADVTASAIGIDKPAMKASFTVRSLPQSPYVTVHRSRWEAAPDAVRSELAARLALPWFSKPARQGSSIGIHKIRAAEEAAEAIADALRYDDVVVVEQAAVDARELEVGVLGNDRIEVTRPGEVLPSHEFYDFEAKYLDDSELIVPADVPADVATAIDGYAREAYRAIGCRGMARVDLFLTGDGQVLVNEINTIPGFTPQSMFPRLWAAEGVTYPALVDRLLALALEAAGERAAMAES
jgi:D-alanine-D-alanine ligase